MSFSVCLISSVECLECLVENSELLSEILYLTKLMFTF